MTRNTARLIFIAIIGAMITALLIEMPRLKVTAQNVFATLNLAQNFTALQEFSAGISGDGTHIETIPNTTSTLVDLSSTQSLSNKSLPWSNLTSFPSACGSNLFVTAVAATPTCTQPAFSNLTGVLAMGQIPAGGSNATFLRGDGVWAAGSAPVSSVFGRTGSVVAAANDYSASQLSNGVTGSGAVVLTTSPALVTPTIGGTTITNVPQMAWGSSFCEGNCTNTLTINQPMSLMDTNTGGITIRAFRISTTNPSISCTTTYPQFSVYDETAGAIVSGTTITTSSGVTSYGVTPNTNVTVSHILDIRETVAENGCGNSPGYYYFNVMYKMQ